MEVLDKLIALVGDVLPLLTALGIPVGSVWGVIKIRKKKQEAATPDPVASAQIVQGTPVPVVADQFEMKTLEYFIARANRLERELEEAHDLLQQAGIRIPPHN
jgi:hypothetical protein